MRKIKKLEMRGIQKLLLILTPSVIVALASSLIIIQSYIAFNTTEGWSMIGTILFFPVLGAAIGLRFLTILLFKKRILMTWIYEGVMVIVGMIFYFHLF